MSDESKRLPPLSDKDEAAIQRQIAADPETAEATEEQLARARPFEKAHPDLAAFAKRARGRPPVGSPKEQVSLRLDADVIEKFRATGRGWQSRINEVLKNAKV